MSLTCNSRTSSLSSWTVEAAPSDANWLMRFDRALTRSCTVWYEATPFSRALITCGARSMAPSYVGRAKAATEKSRHVTPSSKATASEALKPPTATVRQCRHGTRAPTISPATSATSTARMAASRTRRGRPSSAALCTEATGWASPINRCTESVSTDSTVALSFNGVLWVGNDTRPTGGTLTWLPPPSDYPACNDTCPGPTRPDAPASGKTATPSTTAATTVTTHRPATHPRRRPSLVMRVLLRPYPPDRALGNQPSARIA